jgi:hypothetical protein
MDPLYADSDIISEEITTHLPEHDGTIITTISRARTCPNSHQRPPGLLEKNEKPEASTWNVINLANDDFSSQCYPAAASPRSVRMLSNLLAIGSFVEYFEK